MKKRCQQCQKYFPRTYHTPSKWELIKFCSRNCANLSFQRPEEYKTCRNCKEQFAKPRSYRLGNEAWDKRLYCSRKCMGAARDKRFTKECTTCGQKYLCKNIEKLTSYTCSRACADLRRRRRVIVSCNFCNKQFEDKISNVTRGNGKYCSKECIYKDLSTRYQGENGPGWRGGVSLIHERIRASGEYKRWRKAVLKRDKYTCTSCDTKDGILEVDHILPFSLYKDLRFEISNGRTLCNPCHRKTKTYGVNAKYLAI